MTEYQVLCTAYLDSEENAQVVANGTYLDCRRYLARMASEALEQDRKAMLRAESSDAWLTIHDGPYYQIYPAP